MRRLAASLEEGIEVFPVFAPMFFNYYRAIGIWGRGSRRSRSECRSRGGLPIRLPGLFVWLQVARVGAIDAQSGGKDGSIRWRFHPSVLCTDPFPASRPEAPPCSTNPSPTTLQRENQSFRHCSTSFPRPGWSGESLFSNLADLRGSHRPDWPSNSRPLVLVSKTTSERPATSIGLRAPAVRAVQGAELCYGQREDEAIHNAAVFSNVYCSHFRGPWHNIPNSHPSQLIHLYSSCRLRTEQMALPTAGTPCLMQWRSQCRA
jgi:hypothetical protein